jgi:hypothetical protein
MHGDDGVAAIVLAAQHLARLGGLDVSLELVEAARQIPVDGFTRLGPLDQDGQVVRAPLQGVGEVQFFFEAAAPLQQLLRLTLVVPEVRLGDAGLQLVELRAVTRDVKDSSAGRRCVSPGPCSA